MKLSWGQFELYTKRLIKKIVRSSFAPDSIVAVGVSGLIPAAIVAKSLGLKDIQIITVSSYQQDNTRTLPIIFSSRLSPTLKNKVILVVDDIVASGQTFAVVKDKLSKLHPKEVRFAAPVISKFVCTTYPDFWGTAIMRTKDDFISFPWDD